MDSSNAGHTVGRESKSLEDLHEVIDLPRIPDVRGTLTAIEGRRHVPFDIARVYYIYDVPAGAERAGHAHLQLQQLMIATSGSFDVHLDNGRQRKTIHLSRPDQGLLIRSFVWRVLNNFSGGAMCVVLASIPYDEVDYVRDYDTFLSMVES